MQSLAEAIGANPTLRAIMDRPPDLTDKEYIQRFLADVPPTDVARKALAVLEADLEATDADLTIRRSNMELEIRRARRLLQRAEQRDAVQATRPAGCWCLGLGGSEWRYLPDGTPVPQRSCICDEAEVVRARVDEARSRHRHEWMTAQERRLFGAAGVPARFRDCTFDTYPVREETRPILDAVRLWCHGPVTDHLDEQEANAVWDEYRAGHKQSVLLHGPFGTGKTGLAVSCLRWWAGLGERMLFFTVPSLLDAIRATYSPGAQADEREVIEAVKTAPFLVLDDIGAERVTDWVAEKLFTVINHRHDEDLPTVFTSNLDIPQLGAHIGERTVWRIVEMCEVIHVTGMNLRDRGKGTQEL